MARGGGEHRAAAVDVRSGDRPLVDGPREMDPEAHEVADAREAGEEGPPGIRDRTGREDGQGRLREFLDVRRPKSHQVPVAIP